MSALAGGLACASASTAQLPIYPYYCRELSLTVGRWCPLTAADVLQLQEVRGFEGQDVYFWKNHMIKYVRLTGVIVAVDEFYGVAVYTLDDSSGVNIEVTCAAPPKMDPPLEKKAGDVRSLTLDTKAQRKTTLDTGSPKLISPDGPDLTNIDVGSVVKVKGGIGVFRGERQIRLKIITILGDTNAEVKCWNDLVTFKQEVLSTPWVVTNEQKEKCRLEEDREARWKIEKESKMKRDELRRRLREKTKELREKQREGLGRGENSSIGDDHERRKEARRREKHLQQDSDATEKSTKDGRYRGLRVENRVNYPSMAARRRAAGRYDTLEI